MGLLLGHAAFDQIEVLQTFVHRTVAQFDAAAGRGVGQVRRRDVHVKLDQMMETEVRVDIGGRNLARRDRADDGPAVRPLVNSKKDRRQQPFRSFFYFSYALL